MALEYEVKTRDGEVQRLENMTDTTQQEQALQDEIKFLKEELENATKTGSQSVEPIILVHFICFLSYKMCNAPF